MNDWGNFTAFMTTLLICSVWGAVLYALDAVITWFRRL